jgi:hypothetical protein
MFSILVGWQLPGCKYQAVEHLLCKWEALSSNPSLIKKKKNLHLLRIQNANKTAASFFFLQLQSDIQLVEQLLLVSCIRDN